MTELAFAEFETRHVGIKRGEVFVRVAGAGPALLLLHGFSETSLMWRDIAPLLAGHFTVIAADLPGYGRSGVPADIGDAAPMAKRALATTLVECMAELDHARFSVAGHDRGGRVAYRMALDHGRSVTRLAVLDIVPTLEVWERAEDRLTLAFWPFSLLAQPAPLPERLILGDPAAVVDNALREWGSPPGTFPDEVRAAYVEALRDRAHVHAICEEYRAAAGRDRDDDRADRDAGCRIACPLLALWSENGGLAHWYAKAGGPLGIWRAWADEVSGQAVKGGHFFPEEHPHETAALLRDFLLQGGAAAHRLSAPVNKRHNP